METYRMVVGAILIVLFMFLIVLAFKNEATFRQHSIIGHAIHMYQLSCVWSRVEIEVDYCDMESYERTLLRLWDWGYTRILPSDKFEIIKAYIK